MNDSNSSNQINLSKIDLLSLANGIYTLLNINKIIESEEELFSDEVYITIITNLIHENVSPGSTPEEKVKTINLLLSKLSKLIGADLSEIKAEKIIIEHDKENVKDILEFLFELITTLMNSGEEFEEDEEMIMGKHNISDQNINKKKIKSSSFDEDKNFNKDEDDLESLRLSRDKKNDEKNKKKEKKKEKTEESEEMKIENLGLDKEKSQSEENLIFDKDNNIENKTNSKIMNVSHISDEIKDKKDLDEEVDNNNNISNNEIENEDELNDIPALIKNENEKDKSNRDIKNIENESHNENEYIDNDEEEYSSKKKIYEDNKYNFQGSDDDLSSNLKELANSVGPPFIKPLLTNNNSSEEYGDSYKKEKNKNKKDEDDFDLNYNDELVEKNLKIDKNSNTSLLNSNISLHSKKSKKSNRINDSKLQDSSNKKNSTKKKESVLGGNTLSNNASSKKGTNTNKSKNDIDNENEISESQSNDISKSSVYTIHQKSVASSRSKNSKASKKSNKNLNKSNNSKKSSIKEKTRTKSSSSTIINSEIPLDDQGFKFELVKELKKIYGNKIDKVLQGPNNSYSNLDYFLQDLKLINKQEKIRQKKEQNSASKAGEKNIDDKNIDINDNDLLSKEFLIKNQKQLQLMLQSYNQKIKKRQSEQEKYVREIGQNVQFMRKMRELDLKKTENEIETKKRLNINDLPEIKNYCERVFQNYQQLELEKNYKELESINMINNMKLEEKTKNIYDIERYYRDKIAILNEIGRREKKEKNRSKKEDKYMYDQLCSIPKKELKAKMKQALKFIDDDYYNTVEIDNNNQEEIEKILDNYYKK